MAAARSRSRHSDVAAGEAVNEAAAVVVVVLVVVVVVVVTSAVVAAAEVVAQGKSAPFELLYTCALGSRMNNDQSGSS